jgi:hypothetical protein
MCNPVVELSSCHRCLLMNVKYSYRYKTRCCCFACSKIYLGRLEVLDEQSIVLTAVTWGIQMYLNSYSFCICTEWLVLWYTVCFQ